MATTNALELSRDQIEQYRHNGYLIVPDLLTEDEIDDFVAYEAEPKPDGWRENLRHHAEDEQWNALATHPNVVGIVQQLLGEAPQIVQTMYMERQPAGEEEAGTPGVALHQDLHYLPCDPQELMACWIAMTDTDAENGGLCIVPGSHQDGLRETEKNEDMEEHDSWEVDYLMRDRDGEEWTQHMYSYDIKGLDADEVVQLTVPKGAGVFFSGFTIHGSYANRSNDRVRRAFATHYVADDVWMYRADVQNLTPAT